ncbi:MAG: rhodanese-like domain-containing protein [Gammaproteobacteria bacterium]
MDQLLEFVTNNTLLAAGTVAMALAVIFNELRIKADGLSAVTSTQAVRLINGGAKVVDVRDKEHFTKGHIVDALHIPAADFSGELPAKLKNAKSVVLVCDTGGKSGQIVNTLRKTGIESAFSLQGGLGAWERDNLPVVADGNG